MSDYVEITLQVLLILLPVAGFVWCKKRVEPQALKSLDKRREEYGEAMYGRYGEPQQSLWTEGMPLLFYEDFMVLDGIPLPYENIVDVTCNNSNVFSPNSDYQVIVRTTLSSHEFIHVLMGNDMEEAIAMADFIHSRTVKEATP